MLKRKKKTEKQIKPKPTKAPKNGNGGTSQHEMDNRIDYVQGLMGSFLRSNQIVRAVVKKYGVTPRTAASYISKAYERWSKETDSKRKLKLRRAMERVREIGMRALNDGNYGDALRAAERLDKMEGVDPGINVKIDHGGKVEHEHEAGPGLETMLRKVMEDPGKRKSLAKSVAPPREDTEDAPPSKTKRKRAKKVR